MLAICLHYALRFYIPAILVTLKARGHSYQIARRNASLVGWLFLPSGKKVLGVAIWYLQGF